MKQSNLKNMLEVIKVAKKGMRRSYESDHNNSESKLKNDIDPVPEIQGKAKNGNKKAGPM